MKALCDTSGCLECLNIAPRSIATEIKLQLVLAVKPLVCYSNTRDTYSSMVSYASYRMRQLTKLFLHFRKGLAISVEHLHTACEFWAHVPICH